MAKKHIKEEIINTARRLFNARGYDGVSMRDIAETLHISVGNLTYHYPRKEELAEAVVLDAHRYARPLIAPQNLPQLNAFFAQVQNSIQQHAFYFWQPRQLSGLPPAVHQAQTCMMQAQQALLREAFALFTAEGLFAPEAGEEQHARLAQMVWALCVYWAPYARLAPSPQAPEDFSDCIWSVLLPCLTAKGQAVYEKIQRLRVDIDAALR